MTLKIQLHKHPGEPQTHQFTSPPVHQAVHYKSSAPYVHNHYHGTPNNNFPTQAPANTKAGYPPAPYPGVSKEIETKVDSEMEKEDSSHQDTDIEMEMVRLREEIATLSQGRKAKHMKTDIQ